jgi:hypothetical protein
LRCITAFDPLAAEKAVNTLHLGRDHRSDPFLPSAPSAPVSSSSRTLTQKASAFLRQNADYGSASFSSSRSTAAAFNRS